MTHRLHHLIRHKAWWDFKMGGFISTGLLVIDSGSITNAIDAVSHLGFLLCAIMTGAVYASLINDFNDLESDRINGKRNGLKDWPRWLSLAMICIVIIVGMLFAYRVRASVPTVVAYLCAWVTFALYDIRPIYLKNRGIWGALADSCGAHLFPTLFIGFGMQSYLSTQTDAWTIGALAFSSWAIGFRSILSHQYDDLKNDRKTGLRTFAVLQKNTEPVKWLGPIVLFAEVSVLVYALSKMQQTSLLILLGLYIVLAAILSSRTELRFATISGQAPIKSRVWMISYYQSVMPLFLLGKIAWESPWIVLSIPVYIVLFNTDLKIIYRDMFTLISMLKRSD